MFSWFFFFQAEDGIRDYKVTGVQTCALPICVECAGGPGISPIAGESGAGQGAGGTQKRWTGCTADRTVSSGRTSGRQLRTASGNARIASVVASPRVAAGTTQRGA